MTGALKVIYTSCMVLGIVIPLLGLLVGALGNWLDFDAELDIDGDGVPDSPFPVGFLDTLFGALVFGAVGWLTMLFGIDVYAQLVAGVVFGVCAQQAVRRYVIMPLRQNRANAIDYNDLVGKTGTVILTIHPHKNGTISLEDSTGSKITYPASCIQGDIEQGTLIRVMSVDTDTKVCEVETVR